MAEFGERFCMGELSGIELRERAPGVSSGGELRGRCLRGRPPRPSNRRPCRIAQRSAYQIAQRWTMQGLIE